MKKEDIEIYIGCHVDVVLASGIAYSGLLKKSGTEQYKNNPNLYQPAKRYFLVELENQQKCISEMFRSAQIKSIRCTNEFEEFLKNVMEAWKENNGDFILPEGIIKILDKIKGE